MKFMTRVAALGAVALSAACATVPPASPAPPTEGEPTSEEEPRCGPGCKVAVGVAVVLVGGFLLADDFGNELADALTGD